MKSLTKNKKPLERHHIQVLYIDPRRVIRIKNSNIKFFYRTKHEFIYALARAWNYAWDVDVHPINSELLEWHLNHHGIKTESGHCYSGSSFSTYNLLRSAYNNLNDIDKLIAKTEGLRNRDEAEAYAKQMKEMIRKTFVNYQWKPYKF